MSEQDIKALKEEIEVLLRETPESISVRFLTGNADGVRIAFESVLSRQHRMLELMGNIVNTIEQH